MKKSIPLVSSCLFVCSITLVPAQNWPQWMGENRDGKASFTPPKTRPKEPAQKWKVTVGDGVATPALVGDKLYVFSRQEGGEVLRCLDAATGKEIWKSGKQDVLPANGPAQGFSGPRCTPTVAAGLHPRSRTVAAMTRPPESNSGARKISKAHSRGSLLQPRQL